MAQDYVAKIKAMLDRAEHPGTPREEAEASAAKAAEFMKRHGIEEAQIRAAKGWDPEEIGILEMDMPVEHGTVLHEALWPLIQAMGASAIKTDDTLTIVGTRTLLASIQTLLVSVALQMVSAGNLAGDERDAELRGANLRWTDDQIADAVDQWTWDFIRGYGKGLADKILAKVGQIKEEAPGNALVLQSEEDRIRNEFDKMFPHRGGIRRQRVSHDAAVRAGRTAGRAADIGDGRVGSGATTRAIG